MTKYLHLLEHCSGFEDIENCNKVLKNILFGDNKRPRVITEISFQQLTKESGSIWAYKYFFGIEIDDKLNRRKDQYLEHLIKCFTYRHAIIHGSTNMSFGDINPDMIKKNEKIILYVCKLVKDQIQHIENMVQASVST